MDKKRRVPERVLWIGVTAFFLAVIALLSFSPRVLAGNQDAEKQRLLRAFQDVMAFVQDNYVDENAVDTKALMDGAMKGMFEALNDPHSAYLTADDMRDLNDTTMGKFGGVGLIITKADAGAEVVSPIEDTPAYRAGVQAGDVITAIDGETIAEMTTDDVVKILRGQPGTEVTMSLLRGKAVEFEAKVVRALIEVPTVKHAMLPNDIGYLRIIQFTPLTPSRVKESLADFKKQGYRSLVIDLRSNPGGVLSSVIETANYFLSSGPIVSTRSRISAENQVYYASARQAIVDPSLPVMVLIDRGSASASEILAGALKDTHRATLLGEKSYGKGSVQQIRSIGDGGFRLTMSRYYTPAGISIDKIGIQPDIEIKEPELTKAEEDSYTRLLEEQQIKKFVEAHPEPGKEETNAFLRELSGDGDRAARAVRVEAHPQRGGPGEAQPAGLRPGVRQRALAGGRAVEEQVRSFLLPPGYRGEGRLEIGGADHHYLTRVLRVRPGDRFEATDGRGGRFLLTVQEIRPRFLVARVEAEEEGGREPAGAGSPAAHLFHLLQCLPKGNKMDLIVRQATEAGVRRIVPLLSRHTVPRLESGEEGARKVARWQRIAREALQQSGNPRLPEILPPVRLEDYLGGEPAGTGLFLHQEPLEGSSLHELLAGARREILLLVGPEGGLAAPEVEWLLGRGFRPVHVGPNILRSETAALFALAAAQMILKERDRWQLVR